MTLVFPDDDGEMSAGDYRLALAVLERECNHPRRFRLPPPGPPSRDPDEWECEVCHTVQMRKP